MAPRRSRANTPEFPILEANALYAGEIKGDGNCLFNALSDQLYGTQEFHEVLRIETIEHMKEHSGFYRQYMAVNNVRRNPKRRTKASMSMRLETTAYTEEELQRQFEQHVEKMGQPGEWADNMEVSAFASAFHVHVRLWQADYTILISPSFDYQYDEPGAVDDRQTLHIAYHSWEHYSSVRNNAGPHTGVPKVAVIPQRTSMRKRPSPSISGDDDEEMPRARKRRSPLPLFDSDSTPECTESSSDESNGPTLSQARLDLPDSEQGAKPQKLTIKLRCLRTTDSAEPAVPVTAIPPPIVTPPTPLPPSPSPISSPALAPSTPLLLVAAAEPALSLSPAAALSTSYPVVAVEPAPSPSPAYAASTTPQVTAAGTILSSSPAPASSVTLSVAAADSASSPSPSSAPAPSTSHLVAAAEPAPSIHSTPTMTTATAT